MAKKYDVDYYIDKFTKIPRNQWTIHKVVDEDTGQKCALGHCGGNPNTFFWRQPKEFIDLVKVFGSISQFDRLDKVGNINDGIDPRYKQKTPKGRILAALRDIKNG
jgi:hypothetical protein